MHNYYVKIKNLISTIEIRKNILFIVIVLMTLNKGGNHTNYQWLWPPILYFYFFNANQDDIENNFFIPNLAEYSND